MGWLVVVGRATAHGTQEVWRVPTPIRLEQLAGTCLIPLIFHRLVAVAAEEEEAVAEVAAAAAAVRWAVARVVAMSLAVVAAW